LFVIRADTLSLSIVGIGSYALDVGFLAYEVRESLRVGSAIRDCAIRADAAVGKGLLRQGQISRELTLIQD
jgi:hypothetical protein